MAGVQEAREGDKQGWRRPQLRERRVLVFPLPFQGHINPMLQLADVLHARGLAVTVLHTRFNALDPALHPEFAFVSVPDGVPAEVAATGTIIDIIVAMNVAMEASPAVGEALASVLADEGQPRAACLFIDANLLAVQKAAAALGLPTLVLRTGSAACLGCFFAYPMLYQKGYLPPQESQLYMPVNELPPLRVRDLFTSSKNSHEKVRRVLARITETVKYCSGLVINTCETLETTELQRIRDELDLPVVLAAGPLHKLSSKSTGSSLLDQDYSCIEWLDTQLSRSVLYVSFGSLASMDSHEFMEVAWGLANSGHPFLWVVRPGLVQDLDGLDFPDGFEIAIEGRGNVIRWAPQQEVLAHNAVGGFLTHSGWNSTLESISEGVPMICRPQSADQMMNARYVEDTWGVGFELEGKLERGKIESAIRKLMNGKEGADMRDRAKELKKKVADCLESCGSSQIAVDKLVSYILSL
ncbi:DIMBOA UDP-glucosyltransferase BX9-like [Phragmites australis]|uniref:DIMBOA UDP-glucosyltransferase BX9-like n=1 Tax=Phragmites australis TaxID=29695 RepID=UPI002D776E41|nr:DIMBOA UDP-glucosyltransferase BX9-like [Phragmites australis]